MRSYHFIIIFGTFYRLLLVLDAIPTSTARKLQSIYGTLPSSHSSSCSIFLLRCICCSPCLKVHESDSKNDIWLELSHVMSQVHTAVIALWLCLCGDSNPYLHCNAPTLASNKRLNNSENYRFTSKLI